MISVNTSRKIHKPEYSQTEWAVRESMSGSDVALMVWAKPERAGPVQVACWDRWGE
ncbi:hypothetical protein BJ965_005509 [Streptomyces luteogriseus]|uniref:Uncharacterized protein n=1 Tax=Streptomyces luteogriseus TaxID=68233 RepID=A0A7W7DRU9_9ACTN|nr:hypothetical protein [Streptomyces luteogriseus]MBB4715627.1 hypothetical protein [Streptomyces luteogriseus]